jgi:hypothetical protein
MAEVLGTLTSMVQAKNGTLVTREISPVLPFKLFHEVFDWAVVKILVTY